MYKIKIKVHFLEIPESLFDKDQKYFIVADVDLIKEHMNLRDH